MLFLIWLIFNQIIARMAEVMYENSKHANWLLAMLLMTLLISSLILGWLLTRTSVFANTTPYLGATQRSSPSLSSIATTNNPTSIQLPNVEQVKAPVTPEPPAQELGSRTDSINSEIKALPLSLIDSQGQLSQAELTPQAILPLAGLAVHSPSSLPKTTAPNALTPQHFISTNTTPAKTQTTHLGWLYAGQFQNGKWSLVGLDLPENTLPEAQHSYQLTWGAKVRSAPPGQRIGTASSNLAESIGYLAEGSTIKVLSIKQSGKNGHIWLEIAYGE